MVCFAVLMAGLADARAQQPLLLAQQPPLLVFAAASLKEALDEAALQFERGRAQRVSVAYAASSALARQIEKGAPAHVFVSADVDWMDYLEKLGALDARSRVNLVRNTLVLIAAPDTMRPVRIAPGFPLADMLGKGRLAVADPQSVPAGKYARAALQKLGVWHQVADRLAAAENVRAALNFVARGESPLGIVYLTDAKAESRVRVIAEFPPDSHTAIIYPAALTARQHAAGPAFVAFLASDARAIFRKHGFTPLN